MSKRDAPQTGASLSYTNELPQRISHAGNAPEDMKRRIWGAMEGRGNAGGVVFSGTIAAPSFPVFALAIAPLR